MKRKNDRSAKVVLVTSSIVTILVGVSVFSLYSMSKGDEGDTLSIEAEESAESTNSKLLSRMDESAEVVVANTAPAEEAVSAAETIVAESSQPLAVLAVTSTTVDSIEIPGSDNYEEQVASVASVQTTDSSQTVVSDTVTYAEPLYQEAAVDYTEYADTTVYEETAEFGYTEESYAETEYAEYADDSYEAEVIVADSVVEDADPYDSEYTDDTYESDDSADESYAADGEWVYDYDTDEWVYVYYNDTDDSSYDYNNTEAVDESYDQEDTSDDWSDDGGEWVYDYDIDEWVYVYDNDTDDSTDESYDYDTEETDESYDQEDASDDWSDDGGEWVYDYDIDEWVYVYNNDTDDSTDDSYDYDTEETDESYDQEDTSDDWSDDSDSYDYDDSYDNSLGQQIVNYAMNFVGYTPYVWAGRSLDSGTDCSGFVNLIYADFGIYCSPASLAYDGSSFGYIISQDELQPGDIVVYGGGDHVAIYAGDGYVVHCSSPENGTVYWNMYYRSDISWFLRVL